jgi:molybdopterin-guanine dinucleotide biosynthesis protein A
MFTPADVTGLILAGGRGTRMGGADKGLQLLHGKPLVAHALARIAPQVGTVLISANRNQAAYGAYAPVVTDADAGFAGPLAGMLAGLQACATPLLLVVPCDAPYAPLDLAVRLHHALQGAAAPASFAIANGQVHPAFCLIRVEIKPLLQQALESGQRKVQDVLVSAGAVDCDFSQDAHGFENVNDAQALAALNLIQHRAL